MDEVQFWALLIMLVGINFNIIVLGWKLDSIKERLREIKEKIKL